MRTLLAVSVLSGLVFLGAPQFYNVSTKNSQIATKPELPSVSVKTSVGPLTLNGVETSSAGHFSVSSDNSGATSTFTLTNPDRAVIDFFGESVQKSYTVSVNSNKIKQVRIGRHPNKTRVVLDLEDNVVDNVKFNSLIHNVDVTF